MKNLQINNGGLVHCNGSFIATLPSGVDFKIAFSGMLGESYSNPHEYDIEDIDVHTIVPVANPTLSTSDSRNIIIGLLGTDDGEAWIDQQYINAKKAMIEWGNSLGTTNKSSKEQEDLKTDLSDFIEAVNEELKYMDITADDYVTLYFDEYDRRIDVELDQDKLTSTIIDTIENVYDKFTQDNTEK